MADKNMEIMKKVIEAKKQKSAQQGSAIRPEIKDKLAHKANTRKFS